MMALSCSFWAAASSSSCRDNSHPWLKGLAAWEAGVLWKLGIYKHSIYNSGLTIRTCELTCDVYIHGDQWWILQWFWASKKWLAVWFQNDQSNTKLTQLPIQGFLSQLPSWIRIKCSVSSYQGRLKITVIETTHTEKKTYPPKFDSNLCSVEWF